jgi:hypothetical protein
MILLDKHLTDNYIFLSLDGIGGTSSISMTAHSSFSLKEFSTSLSDDLSDYPERYSEFNISQSVFQDYEEGLYIYTVKDEQENVLLTGTLRIIDSGDGETTISIEDDLETDDDQIVYNN